MDRESPIEKMLNEQKLKDGKGIVTQIPGKDNSAREKRQFKDSKAKNSSDVFKEQGSFSETE